MSSNQSANRPAQSGENRFQLVNTVAQQAKIMIAHDPALATATNHTAISRALRKNRQQRNDESEA
jgi:hypothetical protein